MQRIEISEIKATIPRAGLWLSSGKLFEIPTLLCLASSLSFASSSSFLIKSTLEEAANGLNIWVLATYMGQLD